MTVTEGRRTEKVTNIGNKRIIEAPKTVSHAHFAQLGNRIWVPKGKTENAIRFVPISERMKTMLRAWCGSRKEAWVFPSSRSKSGHLTTIAKGFQAARDRAGLDKKLVPYSARHAYGTFTMERSGSAFAVSKSMGHADLKSMEPYQHQELEPLRMTINQRNRRKAFGQVLANEVYGANE
jgi:integrase